MLVGCGHASVGQKPPASTQQSKKVGKPRPVPRQPTPIYELEPIKIQVVGQTRDGAPKLSAFDARELLDDGNEALFNNRSKVALAKYRQLVREFPTSQFVPAAMFNAGLAHEQRRDFDTAIANYRKLAGEYPKSRDAIDAQIRIGALLAELRRFGPATREFERLLERTDMAANDRVESMVRLGYTLVEQKRYARGEQLLREALGYASSSRATLPVDTDYYIAMAHYYLGQIPHRQSLVLPLRVAAGDAQLKKDINRKAELLLLAYERYFRAVKVRHAYWATAAGFQMSQMYREFWDAIVSAPIPPDLNAEKAGYYTEAVHERGLVFLKKALHGHTQNVKMAKAFRTATEWSEASVTQAKEIAALIAKEASGERARPHIRPQSKLAPAMYKGLVPDQYIPGRVDL